jgi:hypothetical protein
MEETGSIMPLGGNPEALCAPPNREFRILCGSVQSLFSGGTIHAD